MAYGYPQVDYGQGAGKAWNPANREELFGMVNRARSDAALANLFAADILTAKGGVAEVTTRWSGSGKGEAKRVAFTNGTKDPLYIKHSLNGAESWAAQAFDTPVLKAADGNYYYAKSQVNGTSTLDMASVHAARNGSAGKGPYEFGAGEKVTDSALIQRLNSGAYAFSAQGANGQTVYVPYAQGYVPRKGQTNQAQTKGSTAAGATARDVRTANTVQPRVVGDPLGLKQTLLGGAGGQEQLSRSLLGQG